MGNNSSLSFLSFIPVFSLFVLPGLFHHTSAEEVLNPPPCPVQGRRTGSTEGSSCRYQDKGAFRRSRVHQDHQVVH